MERARINGIEIAYELCGTSQAATIVMIHGAQGDQTMYTGLATAFAEDYRVLTFDQRGSGLSDKPDMPYSIAMLADDTAALMDHLEISSPHIAGVAGRRANHLEPVGNRFWLEQPEQPEDAIARFLSRR